jgi:hypothetical protein
MLVENKIMADALRKIGGMPLMRRSALRMKRVDVLA